MPQRISSSSIARALRRGIQHELSGDVLHWDASLGHTLRSIVDKNCTIAAPTNLQRFATYVLELHIESYDPPQVTFDAIYASAAGRVLDRRGGMANVLTFTYDGSLMRLTGHTAYEYVEPWNSTLDATPNIATDHNAWRWWAHKRIGQFAYHCPLERATTYHFSQAGNDTTGDGSYSNPFKTLAKAQTLIASDVRLRFKRGEVWTESTGLSISVDNVTVDAFGDESDPLPLFNRFVRDYSAATWTNTPATNEWHTSDAATIVWVRMQADRLGTHLQQQTSQANVQATPNSWYWASGTLYVNLDGDDPNSIDVEGVEQNSQSGIWVNADGCRIENIRADGWGMIGANLGYAFMNVAQGTSANLFVGCHGYFSGTHLMGHLSGGGTGGHAAFVNCRAGFTAFPNGQALYISFSTNGGNETWFVDCEATYGACWTQTQANAIAVAAHTSGSDIGMVVSLGLVAKTSGVTRVSSIGDLAQNDSATISSISQLTACKSFDVNTMLEYPSAAAMIGFAAGRAVYGGRYYLHASSPASTFVGINLGFPASRRAYLMNCYIDVDMAGIPTTSGVFLTNRAGTNPNEYEFLQCFIKYRNCPNAIMSGMDFGVRGVSTIGTGTSRNSRMVNSIFSINSATAYERFVYVTNTPTGLVNNAFYNVANYVNDERGYDQGTGIVTLSSEPIFGVSNAQLIGAGTATVQLSHDINGKRRTAAVPDIGPVDFSSAA